MLLKDDLCGWSWIGVRNKKNFFLSKGQGCDKISRKTHPGLFCSSCLKRSLHKKMRGGFKE